MRRSGMIKRRRAAAAACVLACALTCAPASFLAGCGEGAGTEQNSASAGASAASGTSAGAASASASGKTSDAGSPGEAGVSADGASSGAGGVSADSASGASGKTVWQIFEGSGITAEYACGLDYKSGRRRDVVRVKNEADEELIVSISDFRINDTIYTDEYFFSSVESGKTSENEVNVLTQAILTAELDGIPVTKLSGTAEVFSWETDENGEEKKLDEASFAITFPEDMELEMFCEPAYDMLAEQQILSEDHEVRISLLGCGRYFGMDDGVSGILCIENQGTRDVPFAISKAEINGLTISASIQGQQTGNIPAGTTRYFMFEIYAGDLEDAHIESISDMKLQILTDRDQNSSVFHTSGGKWYSFVLAQHGDPDETFEQGEVVYEDDWVRIGYRGGLADWHSGGIFGDYGSCTWTLAVINKSDENIELELTEQQVNGKEKEELSHVPVLSTQDAVVGANAKRIVTIYMAMDEEIPLPEISFLLQVRKQGGGALLNNSKERVIL